jgi:hypothetical protein
MQFMSLHILQTRSAASIYIQSMPVNGLRTLFYRQTSSYRLSF